MFTYFPSVSYDNTAKNNHINTKDCAKHPKKIKEASMFIEIVECSKNY
jgi:hypothetical protein